MDTNSNDKPKSNGSTGAKSIPPEKISNGTVIDRIPPFKGMSVLEMLGIDYGNFDHKIILLINVPSKKIGKKDVLKIEGYAIKPQDADKLALFCPNASINLISNASVAKKQFAKLPKEISNLASCPNANCISAKQGMKGKFVQEGKGFRCHYCERVFDASQLVL